MVVDNKLSKNSLILNLKQALEVEYKALEGYEDLEKLLKDKTDKNIIEMIADVEKGHIRIVENLIAMVNEHGQD